MITLLLFLQVHFELLGEAGVKGLYNCETIVKTLQFAVQIQYSECKLFFSHFQVFLCVLCSTLFYKIGIFDLLYYASCFQSTFGDGFQYILWSFFPPLHHVKFTCSDLYIWKKSCCLDISLHGSKAIFLTFLNMLFVLIL